jgi:hypothetical protein
LGIFKELCGKDSLNNIVLTTTLWNDIDEETGSARETQLKDGYWQSMIVRGSRMRRFSGTRQSALQLLRPFVDQANALRGVRLRVILPTELPQDEAVPMFRTKIALLQVAHKQQQEILRKIEEEFNTPDNSAKLQMLRKEYEDLKSISSSLLEQMCTSDVWDRGTLVRGRLLFFPTNSRLKFIPFSSSYALNFPMGCSIEYVGLCVVGNLYSDYLI